MKQKEFFTFTKCTQYTDINDFQKAVCPLFVGSARRAKGVRKAAFTLAEVLITLAIIGVVAAITIPGLVTTIKDKVSQRQIQVAEKRLAEGVRLYSQLDSGFYGRTYTDTYDFLKNGLSKHFKMTSICDAEHIADCWPGGKINVAKEDGTLEAVDVSTLKTPDKLGLDMENNGESYYTPASFISGAGVPYIISLKKDCVIDPDSHYKDEDSMACLAGVWDYNGPRIPNKQSVDVRAIGDAVVQGTPAGPAAPSCYASPGGVCIAIQPFYTTAAMAIFAGGNCETLKAGGEVTDTDGVFGTPGAKLKLKDTSFSHCISSGEFWLASKLKCESMGYRLPTRKELLQIAAPLYGYTGDIASLTGEETINGTRGDITQYGFSLYSNISELILWSGVEASGINSLSLGLTTNKTKWRSDSRKENFPETVCVVDE